MRKLLLILLGLLAVLVIALLCSLPRLYKQAVACSNDQYRDNNIAVNAEYVHSGLFSLPKNHRVRLTGEVADEAQRGTALGLFNTTCFGSWLNVDSTGISIAEPEPVVMPEPEPEVMIPSPYPLDALVDSDRRITLTGFVPTQQAMNNIVAVAVAEYGDSNVTNRLEIAEGAPADWGNTAIAAIDAIEPLDNARFEMRDNRLSIFGDAPNPDVSNALQSSLGSLIGAAWQTRYQISVPPPEIVAANTCQQDFNALLASEMINFASDRDTIQSDSFDLLDRLASVADQCPEASIRIAGHTDSQGDEAYNQDLSDRRAAAVVKYLIERGVSASRLTSIGHGEDYPIADNETAEGRALNRRIEFSVQGI